MKLAIIALALAAGACAPPAGPSAVVTLPPRVGPAPAPGGTVQLPPGTVPLPGPTKPKPTPAPPRDTTPVPCGEAGSWQILESTRTPEMVTATVEVRGLGVWLVRLLEVSGTQVWVRAEAAEEIPFCPPDTAVVDLAYAGSTPGAFLVQALRDGNEVGAPVLLP